MSTHGRIALAALALTVGAGCPTARPPPPPPDAPRIESFTTSKARIAAGEAVTLSFSASGATRVELTDDGGNPVQLEGSVTEGTATVAPTRSTFYVLRATGAGGRDTAFVQVAVNEPVSDVFLIAVPPVIEAGDEAQLLWGARNALSATLTTGGGVPQPLSGSTGVVSISPARSERYTLNVSGEPGTPSLRAVADVQVLPVLREAALTADDGVEAGKTLRFTWRTAGADSVTVSEATFGPLSTQTDPSDVAAGSFDYVLPATLPTGVAVANGLPLRFTVTAALGAETRSRTFDTVVGAAPSIDRLLAPEAVTIGERFTVSWRTSAAGQVTITADGQPLFQTRPTEAARVANGSTSLAAPLTETEYTLIASDARGARATRTFRVRPVPLPVITNFTLTANLANGGDAATAAWATMNAVRVQLFLENGAEFFETTTPAQVASGSRMVSFATSARVTLEASSASGAVVRETRAVRVQNPVARVTPTPALRGGVTSLEWQLNAIGVVEVVGLPTPPPPEVQASTRFLDLTQQANAQVLPFDDVNEGVEELPVIPGFRFPLAGTPRPQLFVGANGFIVFARPTTGLPSNVALSTSTVPAMLAPYWDDLTITPTSKVLYLLADDATGEKMLVVQWDKVQIVGDASSELTFQVQLFESGQVVFVYGQMTGTLTGATIGVKDTVAPAFQQQHSLNGAPSAPVTALELSFFAGAPSDGALEQTGAADRRINFFGRTGTGLVPVSVEMRTVAVNEVRVNEVMPQPAAAVAATGQWIELFNTRDASVDFGGLLVTTENSQSGFVIPPENVVPPFGYLVLGQSTNSALNGGAPVTVEANDVDLSPVGLARVSVFLSDGGTTSLSEFSWDASVPGTSVELSTPAPGSVLVASGQTFACSGRMATFGSLGSIGTPGAANEPCLGPYTVTSFDGGFVPAPGNATLITLSSDDEGTAALTLPPLPDGGAFVYFGSPVTNGTVSSNGFFTLGVTTTSASLSNPTIPSTAAPNGVVAPFWDDLVRNAGGKVAMWRESDRTIISFEDFRPWTSSAGAAQLFFQAHLRDDGRIEFRYGRMMTDLSTQTALDLISGSSATIWLERQDGVIAVPWSVNQVGAVRTGQAILFTPRP
jgi:hypothetical protein